MNASRTRTILGWLVVLTVAVAFFVAIFVVVRNRDLKDQTHARSKERTAQLVFLCENVNALRDAAKTIVDPPGAIQTPQRVAALKVLNGANCKPSDFKLTK